MRPDNTAWRASGPYFSTLSSKAGLLDETRHFLLALAETQSIEEVRSRLIKGDLQQRSRATRRTIVGKISARLIRWNPPEWVLNDLVRFAQDLRADVLRSALLLHVPRQDSLLYNIIQRLVVPHWQGSERSISRADVQAFLDAEVVGHPEIESWTYATRNKVAGNALSILRDYGLLRGTTSKQIIEPVIFPEVGQHLVRLLRAEGVAEDEISQHPDWRLWLWDAERAQAAIKQWGQAVNTYG